MPTKINTVSSADLFRIQMELARSSKSEAGATVTKAEVAAAADVFAWGDGKVTKDELALLNKESASFDKFSSAFSGAQDFYFHNAYDAAHSSTKGFSYESQESAVRGLSGEFRWGSMGQGGSTFTPAEATALVSVLGENPVPGRIAQILNIRNDAAQQNGLPAATRKVLDAWLKAHPIQAPEGKLGTDLAKATKGLTVKSDYVRPVIPVELDAPAGKLTATKARKLFAEPTSTPVAFSKPEEFFARRTEITADMSSADKATAKKWLAVRDSLAGLEDVQVVRVGGTNADYYLVGRAENGKLAGVMTSACADLL